MWGGRCEIKPSLCISSPIATLVSQGTSCSGTAAKVLLSGVITSGAVLSAMMSIALDTRFPSGWDPWVVSTSVSSVVSTSASAYQRNNLNRIPFGHMFWSI